MLYITSSTSSSFPIIEVSASTFLTRFNHSQQLYREVHLKSSKKMGVGSKILHWILIADIDYQTQAGFNHPPYTARHTHSTSQTSPSLLPVSLCISQRGPPLWYSKNPLWESPRLVYHRLSHLSSKIVFLT